MKRFARHLGGVLPRTVDSPFGFNAPCNASFLVIRRYLDDFVGTTNGMGDSFSYDLQILDNEEPNAVCGRVGNRFCIGLNTGLLAKIVEIALVLALATSEKGRTLLSRRRLSLFGKAYRRLSLDTGGRDDLDLYIDELQGDVERVGRWPHMHYCANALTLFVMLHEAAHAIEGHVLHLCRKSPKLYLGESNGPRLGGDRDTKFLCEFAADTNAMLTLLRNIFAGERLFALSTDLPIRECA